jgi:hypothetical protein
MILKGVVDKLAKRALEWGNFLGRHFMKNFPYLLLRCLAIAWYRGHSEDKRVSRLPLHPPERSGVFNPVPIFGKGVSV